MTIRGLLAAALCVALMAFALERLFSSDPNWGRWWATFFGSGIGVATFLGGWLSEPRRRRSDK